MRLRDFVATYISTRDTQPATARHYQEGVSAFERWRGRPIFVVDLVDALLNDWLEEMASNGLSPSTALTRRSIILALWKSAVEHGLTAIGPGIIRTVKVRPGPPQAWSVDEVRRIFAATDQIEGYFPWSGVKRSDYWSALIRFEWDTALRLTDLLTIPLSQIGDDGILLVTQNKTGLWLATRVRSSTRDCLERIDRAGRGGVCQWGEAATTFRRAFKGIVRAAGLKGTWKKLRKSSASNVELHYPGCGAAHLGHARGVAQVSYLDPRIIAVNRPLPEEL